MLPWCGERRKLMLDYVGKSRALPTWEGSESGKVGSFGSCIQKCFQAKWRKKSWPKFMLRCKFWKSRWLMDVTNLTKGSIEISTTCKCGNILSCFQKIIDQIWEFKETVNFYQFNPKFCHSKYHKFLLFLNPVCNFCDWWEHQKQRVKKMAPSFTQRYNARSIASLCWIRQAALLNQLQTFLSKRKFHNLVANHFGRKVQIRFKGVIFFMIIIQWCGLWRSS